MGSMSFSSTSPEDTRALGEALGRVLQEGDFVGLVGDLGAGKTELARGIARGVGIRDEDVTSPSFSIVHQHHGTGFHELRDGPGATLVEWVDRVASAAPPDAMRIVLLETSETARELVVAVSGPRSEHLLQRWKDELIGLAG